MNFDTSTPKHITDIVAKPFGPALGDLGILSKEQQDESGRRQAAMIAIRIAIENNFFTQDTAKNVIGENRRGGIDLDSISKMDQRNRTQLLDQLGVTPAQRALADMRVKESERLSQNVNLGHDIQVPQMGFIHSDAHGATIPNFDAARWAFLMAQRAGDAMASLRRIAGGQPKPADTPKRGYGDIRDNEPQELQHAIDIAKEMNTAEDAIQAGQAPNISGDAPQRIVQSLEFSAQLFRTKGFGQQAKIMQTLQNAIIHEIQTLFPPQPSGPQGKPGNNRPGS